MTLQTDHRIRENHHRATRGEVLLFLQGIVKQGPYAPPGAVANAEAAIDYLTQRPIGLHRLAEAIVTVIGRDHLMLVAVNDHGTFAPAPAGRADQIDLLGNEVGQLHLEAAVKANAALDTVNELLTDWASPTNVWVIGRDRREGEDGGPWQLQGIQRTEDDARAACLADDYFIYPVEVGDLLPDRQVKVPGFYPRLMNT